MRDTGFFMIPRILGFDNVRNSNSILSFIFIFVECLTVNYSQEIFEIEIDRTGSMMKRRGSHEMTKLQVKALVFNALISLGFYASILSEAKMLENLRIVNYCHAGIAENSLVK